MRRKRRGNRRGTPKAARGDHHGTFLKSPQQPLTYLFRPEQREVYRSEHRTCACVTRNIGNKNAKVVTIKKTRYNPRQTYVSV